MSDERNSPTRAALEPSDEQAGAHDDGELKAALRRLSRRDIRQVALLAFAVGVLFHACVVYAVLGSGGGPAPSSAGSSPSRAAPAVTSTPTAPPDRTDCAEIRGTDYRSEAERQWFQRNCVTLG